MFTKILKAIIRFIITIIFVVFLFPVFIYKKYGNTKYKLKDRTIIISNHFSDFDMVYIYLIYGFKKHLTFVAFEGVNIGWSKIFAFAYDVIFVYAYKNLNVVSLFEMIKLLKNDGILVLFPEGYIDYDRDSLYPFSESYLFLAKQAKASILPLTIVPKNKFFQLNKIYIGEPILYSQIEKEDRSSLNKLIRKDIYNNLVSLSVKMKEDKDE